MRSLLITLLGLISVNVVGQSVLHKFDTNTWKPPYKLVIPAGWTTERFPIPIDFAPQIPYQGVEELRFAPGWAKLTSADYWSYAYVWWLEGSPTPNVANLQENLTAYYSGLIARNISSRHILPSKVVPTSVLLKKVKSGTNGDEIYSGTITMLDYMSPSSIKLNCLIHVHTCHEQGHTAIIFELSPKPVEHAIWQKLHAIQSSFACQK